jgi:hypothetical protein
MSQMQPPSVLPRPPRLFSGEKILTGEINLDAYPFRYVSVVGAGFSYNAGIDMLLSAVELLETRGWQLISITGQTAGQFIAFLRRG